MPKCCKQSKKVCTKFKLLFRLCFQLFSLEILNFLQSDIDEPINKQHLLYSFGASNTGLSRASLMFHLFSQNIVGAIN